MLNRKLLEVLSRLTPAEKKKWRLFLDSPYFNHSKQAATLVQLSEYILKYDALETHPKLDKAVVSEHFFPDHPFREGEKNELDGLMSRLFVLARTFLAQEQQERSAAQFEHNGYIAWLSFCRRHGLEERFRQGAGMLRQIHERWPTRDKLYYRSQLELTDEITSFETTSNRFRDDANIGLSHAHLDIYYVVSQMERSCALLYQQQMSPTTNGQNLVSIEDTMALARKGSFDHLPVIELFRLVYELLSDRFNEDLLQRYDTFLEAHQHLLSFDTLYNLKSYQRMFWVRHYLKWTDTFHLQKMFDIYKDHFEHGLLYVEGNITMAGLRNLTVFALKARQFDWIKTVIDTHPPSRICGTNYPEEVYHLSLAEYHFNKQEYDLAIENLQYRLFENQSLSLAVDMLLIKTYMETGNELLESRMHAFERKVRRMKIYDTLKERQINFLKKLDKINRHLWQKNSPRYEKMLHELQSIPQLSDREWLMKMLEKKAR